MRAGGLLLCVAALGASASARDGAPEFERRQALDLGAGVSAYGFTDLTGDSIPHFEPGVDPDRPVLFSRFDAIGHSMYSPTAAMVYQFREVALFGNDTRVAHFDQPKFAWR